MGLIVARADRLVLRKIQRHMLNRNISVIINDSVAIAAKKNRYKLDAVCLSHTVTLLLNYYV